MDSALRLEVDAEGLATLTFDLSGKRVNVFTLRVLEELRQTIDELGRHRDIRALILLSGKPGSFIAGFDINEIADVTDPAEAEEGSRVGHRLFAAWAALPFPTVAAIQGTCMGGGTELSLASDAIVSSDRADIRIGLPEVRLGILPAWGGCSRLPRRVGLTAALDIILTGKAIDPRKAFRIGLADALLPDAVFLPQAFDFAARLADGWRPTRRRPDLKSRLIEGHSLGRGVVFRQARKAVLQKTGGHYPAPLRAIEVVEVGVTQGLEAGLDAEARATSELAVSPVSKNLVHVFRLMEKAKNRPLPAEPRELRATAVLGAGVMGGGIAHLIANRADLIVRLKDLASAPLASALAHAARLFAKQVKRQRLSRPEQQRKMNLLQTTTDYDGMSRTDLVIEAVVENLEVKRTVFREVASHVPDSAILASNTSSLEIDDIAQGLPSPQRVIGMHFFNPVDRMPLVEVIRGTATDDQTLSTIVHLARRLGKTPVVVGDGPGFLVNRLLGFYMAEALWLLDEGFSVDAIDGAMRRWGMPLGPLALIDEVGADVALEVAHILATSLGKRLALPDWAGRLTESGHLGAKTGRGIYRYSKGERQGPDPDMRELLELPPPSRSPEPTAELVDRLVLPMVNEAARILDEGIVASPGEIDLAMIMGTGFPPFRGGLCRWSDQQGLPDLAAQMQRLAEHVGERYRPSAAFERLAAKGGFYALEP